jgi:DNA repair protein RecN (Recombination protein N)
MLTELRIENFAIIENLVIELGSGLVTFTGETGAGKSILVDAVETLLGVRADTTLIRAGDDRARVEGTFHIRGELQPRIQAILEREDMLDDSEYIVMQREFRRAGRNVARINGRVATLAVVKELSELLIDLHGQSEHLSLLRVPSHRVLLDRFAGLEKEFASYQEAFHALQSLRTELTDLRDAEQEAASRIELMTFQVEEISSANLQLNEEDGLREERTRLANSESLAENVNLALASLDEAGANESPAADQMGQVLAALRKLSKVDESQLAKENRAQNLFDEMADLARELRAYLDEIEFNPSRLEEVEERLGLIQSLKRKYGEDIAAVLAHAGKTAKDLENITNAEARIAQLETDEIKLLNDLASRAEVLSKDRHEAAEKLAKAIEKELTELRMQAASFGVDFHIRESEDGLPIGKQKLAFDSNGHESLEFMVAPNPGEGLKPLVKIASGGETARLMLAMKNVLARADQTPTLIFDEIDQGIGGRIGAVVGKKLWHLAREHQVLCVTHLPQLAAYGDQHFKVEKDLADGRTSTKVVRLNDEPRVLELANMLGDVSEGTLQSATELLASVQEITTN